MYGNAKKARIAVKYESAESIPPATSSQAAVEGTPKSYLAQIISGSSSNAASSRASSRASSSTFITSAAKSWAASPAGS